MVAMAAAAMVTAMATATTDDAAKWKKLCAGCARVVREVCAGGGFGAKDADLTAVSGKPIRDSLKCSQWHNVVFFTIHTGELG